MCRSIERGRKVREGDDLCRLGFTTARERGGTGLGLPIVRAIAIGALGTAKLVEPGSDGKRMETR